MKYVEGDSTRIVSYDRAYHWTAAHTAYATKRPKVYLFFIFVFDLVFLVCTVLCSALLIDARFGVNLQHLLGLAAKPQCLDLSYQSSLHAQSKKG